MSDIHVLPINDLVDHDEREDCWCQPAVLSICPECEDGDVEGCWYCNGSGVVRRDLQPDSPCMVIHNAADGRE